MHFAAGCWINGTKLQDNEAKKKVVAYTLWLASSSFCVAANA